MDVRTEEEGDAPIRVSSYGPNGTYVDLGIADQPARAERSDQAARALAKAFPESEVVRGAGTIALFSALGETAPEREAILRALHASDRSESEARTHQIPVVYDGPDLVELSQSLGLSAPEIVALHSGQDFVCELVGFMPGFAYLGVNPALLVLPRRATPRSRVPAGSVALAGAFSGIYPAESPGGWHLIGRSLGPALFDPRRAEPSLFAPGDRARFVSVGPRDAPRTGRIVDLRISLRARPSQRGLVVLEAPPLTTLQDKGRFGLLSRGIPSSGPLVPEARRRAERALGNSWNAASLEFVGGDARLRAVGRVRIALDDGTSHVLGESETFVVPASGSWARYLAIEGGFEGERVLGSRATLLGAGLGGHEGRVLRAGDFLSASEGASALTEQRPERDELEERDDNDEKFAKILVDPGPHAEHFPTGAFERLLRSEYTVSRLSNRIGQRLVGPKVERLSGDTLLPVPMIRGAIEVPGSGEPIVLGPDHPTTGGYPVVAVVRPESWGTMGRLGPGSRLRFVRP